jgi:hypothetical protein
MHPEIKKFWEDAGYLITELTLAPNYPTYNPLDAKTYWSIGKDDEVPYVQAITLENGTNLYYLNDEKLSEEVALRMIRLKSFM